MKVLDIIAEIVAEKTGKKLPTHATVKEVTDRYPQAKAEIDQLEREGRIKLGPTINSDYITVINS